MTSSADIPNADIPNLATPPPGETPRRRVSAIWLVPFIALAVSLGVAWKTWSERGPLIEISFQNAAGVKAGATEVRYRDVAVGLVEDVRLTADLSAVIAAVRMDREVAPYLDEDAQFWVVRPKVSVREISGLDTVLSGAFIQGEWDAAAGEAQQSFTGREAPPVVRADQAGRWFTLEAATGNRLSEGAPIVLRGVPVGYIDTPRLAADASRVTVRAFVEAPYDATISAATRFWDTSGFTVSLGSGGLDLQVSSLASLVEGGVAFDTLVEGGDPVGPDQVFTLFRDEVTARDSLFAEDAGADLMLSVIYSGSASGLAAGADVRLRGVRVGHVTDVRAVIDGSSADEPSRREVRVRAAIALNSTRLGLRPDATEEEALDFLADYVAEGLRARLTTGGLLNPALVIDLVETPNAAPASLDLAASPHPVLPSIASEISDFSATAEGVLDRINSLPIEDLLASIISLSSSLDTLVRAEETQAAPAALIAALGEISALLEDLRAGGAVANANAALSSAGAAAAALETAAADLPALTRQLGQLAAQTGGALDAYGAQSKVNAELLATLRDVQVASDAITKLVRNLQRNPNSLLFGR